MFDQAQNHWKKKPTDEISEIKKTTETHPSPLEVFSIGRLSW